MTKGEYPHVRLFPAYAGLLRGVVRQHVTVGLSLLCGVVPSCSQRPTPGPAFPRMRGVVPGVHTRVCPVETCSPRTRGCSVESTIRGADTMRSPHVRGCSPTLPQRFSIYFLSPHTRGWPAVVIPLYLGPILSPRPWGCCWGCFCCPGFMVCFVV